MAGGSVGTFAGVATFAPSGEPGGEPGAPEDATVAPGTRAVAPASEAGIARKSASLSWPNGGDEGGVGSGADATTGALGGADIAFAEENDGGDAGETVLGTPPSRSGRELVAVLPVGAGLPGSAAKNSFASRAIAAGSSCDAVAANGFSYSVTPSCLGTDMGTPAATRSFVLMILVDIDVLQHADGVLG
jgi:hypothetical protein